MTVFEQAQGVGAGFAADNGISAAFEGGLHIGHDGRFIFDEQHGQGLLVLRLVGSWLFDSCATLNEAVCRMAGQADDERRSLVRDVVVTENFAAVFVDDSVADAQAETGSLANFFGGEERIENAGRDGRCLAVVGERNFDRVSGLGGHDLDAAGTADFAHRVIGIVQDVEEDLLQLVRVTQNVGEVLRRGARSTSMP